jgi:signal transduction histidine kinase/CheY-like chemotaxis protein/HPt (histidine-containing phosphotransfer) domain-containing protein
VSSSFAHHLFSRRSRPIYAAIAAGLSAILGILVLIGWAFDSPALRGVIRGAVEMKANTAVTLIAAAGALWILSSAQRFAPRRFAQGLALLVALLGMATLCEYLFGWNLQIDELLVRDTGAAFNHKGRMSPFSAVAFVALGASLFGLRYRTASTAVRSLASLVTAIGVVGLLGYLWNAAEIVTDGVAPPVAIHTALAFMLLGGSVLLISLHPELPPNHPSRSRIEAMAIGGFVPAAMLVIIGGGYTYQSGATFADSSARVAHSQEVRAQLGRFYASMSDAESALGNYLLVGDTGFRRDFVALIDETRSRTEALGRMVKGDPAQALLFQRLTEVVEARIETMQAVDALFRARGETAARAAIATGRSARLMQDIRAVASRIDDVEADALRSRGLRAQGQRRTTLVSLLATLLVTTGLFMLLFRGIRREMLARAAAEDGLQRLNVGLKERTRALHESNLQLEQARLESDGANRAKSAFLAAMSHEIRTPMNGVIGMIDVLAQSRLDNDQREAVHIVRDSSFALLRLIDDVLDFSKIEAGRMELERTPVFVAEAIEGVCRSLALLATDKDVGLRVFVDPKLPQQLWTDPTRLRQVLTNLVGNAIKFSAAHGAVRGRVRVRAEAAEDGRMWTLQVADNGIGMTAETVSHLFTSFTQAEISMTRRFGGTGLGLAISHRLVALMDGSIEVNSELGVGSSFTVRLPMHIVEGDAVLPMPDLSGLNCVIVETFDLDASDFARYLELSRATIHREARMAEAQSLAARLPAAVLIAQQEPGSEPLTMPESFLDHPQLRKVLLTLRPGTSVTHHEHNVISVYGNGLGRLGLLRAVAAAAGRASPDLVPLSGGRDLVVTKTAPTVEQARASGCLILVAEDDAINRKVIHHQLGLLGHACEIVENGARALEHWRRGGFALLITDLHMPSMDGFTLAASIRREEAGRRLPIVALTANALLGEAERARAAGIDEYLTKPMQLRPLGAAIDKWLGASPLSSVPTEPSSGSAAVFDPDTLPRMVGGDMEVVRSVLSNYVASACALGDEMRRAAASNDKAAVVAVAHQLKASSRSVGALALGDECEALEAACPDELDAQVARHCKVLDTAVTAVMEHLGAS